jgi:hypothetical protein
MTGLYYIIAGAGIGSLFTILVQSLSYVIKRRRIKKSLNQLLQEVILPIITKLRVESESIKEYVKVYSFENVTLGMHPAFNSAIIKSYSLHELRSAYGKKMPTVIDIISILDNLENRKPIIYLDSFIKDTNHHFEKEDGNDDVKFASDEEHFYKCHTIQQMKVLTKINLENVEEILNQLEENIIKLQ